MPFLPLTDEEAAAVKELEKLAEEVQEATSFTERAKTRDLLEEASTSPLIVTAGLKNKINAVVDQVAPDGSFSHYIDILEDALGVLDGEDATRVLDIGKDLLLRLYGVAQDPDLVRAAARTTYVKYKALVEAGFSEETATKLLLARASSRPFNLSPNFSTNKR